MGRVVGAAASLLGHSVRLILLSWPFLFRLAGYGLMTYAVWQFDHRIAWGFAGLCLLALTMATRPTDRRKT